MAGDTAHAVLGILQHIGLFAIIVVGYGVVRGRLGAVRRNPRAQEIVLGVFFGAGAVFAMIQAVTVMPGVILDARSTMLALAALYGGPVAALIAGAMAGGYRLFLGGSGAPAGLLALAAVTATALGYAALARRRGWPLDTLRLAALGLFTTSASLAVVVPVMGVERGAAVVGTLALPLLVANSVGTAFLGTLLRLEERRHAAEAALTLSEAHYRALFHEATDSLFVVDVADGGFTFQSFNPATERWLGIANGAGTGRRPDEVLPPDVAATCIEHYRRCVAVGETVRFEITADLGGSTRTWDTVLVPLSGVDGRVVRLLGTSRDVTEHRRLVASLAEAKEQAEAGARAKSDFLAAMSHEIRTPMNGIIGYATFLEDLATTADQRHYARQLRQASRSLLAIINDVLDFSKIEAGKVRVDSAPFDLREAVEQVVALVQPDAREKGLDLRLDLAPDLPACVTGDAVRLRQILLNLLSNAVKFTPRGGVALSVLRLDAAIGTVTLNFVVADSGIGIAPDKQALLFEKFSQVDRTVARKYGGTGLGLAISKALTEAMGGRIGFHSVAGVGSTFHVTLTLPVPDAAALAASSAGGAHAADAPRHGRILLAEDLAMNQELTGTMLRKAGHTVDIADDGAQAVEAVRRQRYDLVLMDLQMPVMDGLLATKAIRALPGGNGAVPIVALTASVQPEEIERCRAAGMDGHVAKPVERDALLGTIQHWLHPAARAVPAPASVKAG
ncbi:ATP-binding protein [Azospirillum sp. sgz301742]